MQDTYCCRCVKDMLSYTHLQLFFKNSIHLLHHSTTPMNKGIAGEGLPFTRVSPDSLYLSAEILINRLVPIY